MRIEESPEFTWYLPNKDTEIPEDWICRGGKWVIHNSLDESRKTANKLDPYLEDSPIRGAKIWHGDPTALIVYSLDTHRREVTRILDSIGAGNIRVWVYDNPIPNFKNPFMLYRAISLMIDTMSKGEGHYRKI